MPTCENWRINPCSRASWDSASIYSRLRFSEILVNFALFGAVVITVENLGDFGLQRRYELIHIFLEHFSTAGRYFQTLGFVDFLEIKNIAPVRRRGFLPGLVFDKGPGRISEACLRRPGNEDVISMLLHAHPELDGVDRALLSTTPSSKTSNEAVVSNASRSSSKCARNSRGKSLGLYQTLVWLLCIIIEISGKGILLWS